MHTNAHIHTHTRIHTGGEISARSAGIDRELATDTVEEYSVKTNTWRAKAHLPQPKFRCGLSVGRNGLSVGVHVGVGVAVAVRVRVGVGVRVCPSQVCAPPFFFVACHGYNKHFEYFSREPFPLWKAPSSLRERR